MNALLLSRYGRKGASSRVRMFQYEPFLEAAGFEIRREPLFNDACMAARNAGKSSLLQILGSYAARLKALAACGNVDLVWLEKEALPWLPWQAERTLFSRSVPIVSDYDDAIFHNYDLHDSAMVRATLGCKIDKVMTASTHVLAGNSYLAQRAIEAGASAIDVIPSVIDVSAYRTSDRSGSTPPVIGWIGSPSTWDAYVEPHLETIRAAADQYGASVRTVGAGPQAARHDFVETVEWSEDLEVEEIGRMDIGLMPLTDTPWARGKCGYKLIQYMGCGLPVIASPVGVNRQIVDHGVNGFLATSEQEWRQALEALLCDPALRRQMGAAGRKKVEQEYSLQVFGPKVAEILLSVARQGR